MPPRRRLNAVKKSAEHPRPPDLREAVDAAVAAMPWAADTDGAIVALAKRLAAEIEQAVDRAAELADLMAQVGGDRSMFERLRKLEAMCDVTKSVGWLGPQLQGAMKELGGSPASRKAMQQTSPVGGAIAALRASVNRPTGGAGPDSAETVDPPPR